MIKGLWRRLYRQKEFLTEKEGGSGKQVKRKRIETAYYIRLCQRLVAKPRLNTIQAREMSFLLKQIPRALEEFELLLEKYIERGPSPPRPSSPVLSRSPSPMIRSVVRITSPPGDRSSSPRSSNQQTQNQVHLTVSPTFIPLLRGGTLDSKQTTDRKSHLQQSSDRISYNPAAEKLSCNIP